MNMKLFYNILFIFFLPSFLFSQSDIPQVKYTREFKFNDGIYQSFKEFKYNNPSLPEFSMSKDNNFIQEGNVILRYPCPDSIGSKRTCVIENCFGFSRNGILYLNQGYPGYYYRMFIVGALSHFIAFNKFGAPDVFATFEPFVFSSGSNDFTEYLLDFETGNTFRFGYTEFSEFLEKHDKELFDELQNTKQKRKMIHHFLLKYNEKHPIYFPVY
ncbi:MAG: hypothetical protein PHR81_00935 [Bacteroidales bacterium]|jgi:hypothetical protein|nr:hypothetical protein [Bacteroidales bacterium]MDD4213354.1 hypothetical protein [Bacteroidales bacterium]